MCMNSKKIAIMGATSHIAKNLIYYFSDEDVDIELFARNRSSLIDFIKLNISNPNRITVKDFEIFFDGNYDVIINCIGVGDPVVLNSMRGELLLLTERYDNLILEYLHKNSNVIYINFSSGAAYGTDFSTSASKNKMSMLNINNITSADYYTVCKINSEVKHRGFSNLNIIDLRIFGFYSRFIKEDSPYFLNEVFNCLKEKKIFVTTEYDFIRDFVHPKDLCSLIDKIIDKKYINKSYDVYSLSPISKWEILNYFSEKYGLEIIIENDSVTASPTGIKYNYFSSSKLIEEIGYYPKYSSLESIVEEFNSK